MTESEPDPAERSPVESARPSIGRRDEPDALRPDVDDRPHRTIPPDQEEEPGAATEDGPDGPRPAESPAPRD
jgi:hypothetical protein